MNSSEVILSDISPRDFHATYADTYLQFKSRDDDGWYPGRVYNIESDGDDLAITVEKLNGDRVLLYSNDPDNHINFDWPRLGFINSNKHSLLSRTCSKKTMEERFQME